MNLILKVLKWILTLLIANQDKKEQSKTKIITEIHSNDSKNSNVSNLDFANRLRDTGKF